MKTPSFSLVMTVYNCSQFVEAALRSMVNQDYAGAMEFIVVDDASTDGTREVVERLVGALSKPIKTVFLSENRGVVGACEAGWRQASGEWIIMVDGDDVQMADRCSKVSDLIRAYPDVGMVCMSARNMDAEGKLYGYTGYGLRAYQDADDELYLKSTEERVQNMTHPVRGGRISGFGCAMAIKRTIVEKWGFIYHENHPQERFAQDPTWELRAMLSAPLLGSRQVACFYRSHAGNLLNKTIQAEGWRWLQHKELEMSRFFAFEAASFRQMLRDVERAQRDPGLSDWSPEQLEACRETLLR